MKTFSIPQSWIALHPTRRMDAGYWAKVVDVLRNVGVEPSEASRRQIQSAIVAADLDEASEPLVAEGA